MDWGATLVEICLSRRFDEPGTDKVAYCVREREEGGGGV